MSRFSLRVLVPLLALSLLAVSVVGSAATAPTLFSMPSGKAEVLAQGAQKSWPIKVSEDSAFNAIFQGGMWLPNPAGGRIYAKYQRHILHANGTWSWIGTVDTVHGAQPVVLTFGPGGGVFGLIPQASGYPLRIVSNATGTHVVATSATAMAQSAEAMRLYSAPDYVIPPKVNPKGGALTTTTQSVAAAASAPVQAAASGPVIIDVMVAYTPGFVAELGSTAQALTRIQNLVDITNAAYVASGVNQQIRLVHTVQVNYPDNTSNQSALDDITGINENGGTVPIPPSLQNIASLRDQYGADLVALIRSYDNATQGDCGVGWLIGGNQTPIVPSEQKPYGYSVVSDGSSGGYYCLPTTFAHELGHNMGSAHDRANATEAGAYSYSYGYVGNGVYGFSTIMAYGKQNTTPLAVFSNPDISTCQNTPCGVADSASDSADNAHSLNNTAPLIAQFEPTMVGTSPPPGSTQVHNDVNGDGRSDLLWYNASSHQMTYWLMNGATTTSWQALNVPAGYVPIATGDFNGDGYADILWTDASGNVYMWLNNGNGTFTSSLVSQALAGWQVVGTVDVNGDGRTDLIWYNAATGQMTYWLMKGATRTSWWSIPTNPGLKLLATGDFDGSGYGDIIWTSGSGAMYMWLGNSNGTFSYNYLGQYPAGWAFAGTGDVNGDGKTDLLWYNPATGQMTYWLMNGASVSSWQGFQTNAGLTPLATGKFDGTNAGLTWRASSGGMYMWLFNTSNATSLNYYPLGNYPTGWTPIP
ncbi:MAG: hypothetical protein OJF55_001883 [Rhodanobacteraceae bacterium]|jgi:hypothetical protein|nr:MAG: hypothetical protein OJF55_001883 [Rhodanobacteraceae bacterium]